MSKQQSVRIIQSESYGDVEVDDSQIYHFPKGIIGFADIRDYALIQVKDAPYYVLHALEVQLSFIVLPASAVTEDYGFRIDQNLVDLLAIQQPEDVIPFVILNVIDDQLYVNMKAPLIINGVSRKGAQHIIDDPSYSLRQPLLFKEDP